MVKSHPLNPNLAQILLAASRLRPLLPEIAFVGGCVTGLLLTDPAAAPVRATLDVDAIVEIVPTLTSRGWKISFSGLGSAGMRPHRSAVGLRAI